MHLHSYSSSCIHGALSRDTPGTANIASDVGRAYVGNGAIGAGHPNTGASFVDAIDPELLKYGMASNLLDSKC